MNKTLSSGIYSAEKMTSVHPDLIIQLDDQGEVTKNSVLNALSAAFGFPDYFGYNWDAAFDCLCDALEAHDNLDVLFRRSPDATLEKVSLDTFVTLLNDVIEHQPKDKLIRFFFEE